MIFDLSNEIEKWCINPCSDSIQLKKIIIKFIKKDTKLIFKYVKGSIGLHGLLEKRNKLLGEDFVD